MTLSTFNNRESAEPQYRDLTGEEIITLEENACRAEDWSAISVAEGFRAEYVRGVSFYGTVRLGAFEGCIDVGNGFTKHSGISNATLRNVTIGDNCLIENILNHINNYNIGDGCYISNVGTMETTEGATYGEGNLIAVLNEAGEGNIIIFSGLTSQIAALMTESAGDTLIKGAIRRLTDEYIARRTTDCGVVGCDVKIVNTKEITNTIIYDECEVSGAARLSECTIISSPESSVYIGTGAICDNSIISYGASITDNACIQDCFVGEACKMTGGFSATSSVFFANSHMARGEACATFCGPFCTSHHKSTLLIGGMYSFFNAGSATNFSNHAYKMGPIHYGTFCRGTKTASGTHILLPAQIGAFTVCLGKIACHPETRNLPFSYLIGDGKETFIVPGRNLITAGTYRDIHKWPKRDMRSRDARKSIVNHDWLSPYTVGAIIKGRRILEQLRDSSDYDMDVYKYHGCSIRASALQKGIDYYDIALRLFIGEAIKKYGFEAPTSYVALEDWDDLSGLLLPMSKKQRIIEDIANGEIATIDDLTERFAAVNAAIYEYQWAWTWHVILDYYGLDNITEDDKQNILRDCCQARKQWLAYIKKDAEKEYELGDVDEKTYEDFICRIDGNDESGIL